MTGVQTCALPISGRDSDICLRATPKPEFDAWRWSEYWVPLDSVIEFKRVVYEQALTELARLVFNARERTPKWTDCAKPAGQGNVCER